MYHYCYKINFPNGDYYIGKRSTPLQPEVDPYMGSGKNIKSRKDGVKNILSIHKTLEEAFDAEIQHIGGRNMTDPKCLNITKGGSNIKGLNWSDDMRLRRSQISRSYWTPETRQKHSQITKSQMTPERIEFLRKIQTQRQSKPEIRFKHSEFMKVKMIGNSYRLGYKESTENKKKISDSLLGNTRRKGKLDSEETKKRKSDANKGIPKPRIDCPLCGSNITKNTLKRHQAGPKCLG